MKSIFHRKNVTLVFERFYRLPIADQSKPILRHIHLEIIRYNVTP